MHLSSKESLIPSASCALGSRGLNSHSQTGQLWSLEVDPSCNSSGLKVTTLGTRVSMKVTISRKTSYFIFKSFQYSNKRSMTLVFLPITQFPCKRERSPSSSTQELEYCLIKQTRTPLLSLNLFTEL